MNITLTHVTVRDLAEGYSDQDEAGVFGYGDRLDIRPPYQREFIYGEEKRNAVIDTLTKGYPLNVMYWVVRDDGNFEVLDGQQRTISICQYVHSKFAFNKLYFHNLTDDQREQILDYTLTVYRCEGTHSEKLEWFKTINIAGVELTLQELRNAVFAGPWVSDAKRYFSKTGCAAYKLGGSYMTGKAIRQEYLQTVIKWISDDDIEGYMADHQHDTNANELWLYFQAVVAWIAATFPTKRDKMASVPWGALYAEFKSAKLDPAVLEEEVARLMKDDDVTNKAGIYSYVLTQSEKSLNIRKFSENQKIEAYERQKGLCAMCKKPFPLGEMHADHIVPWHKGGRTEPSNCQMLCRDDNLAKGGK